MTAPAPTELLKLAEAALEYIDAIPKDIVLPAMPGFDRDWAADVIRQAASVERVSLPYSTPQELFAAFNGGTNFVLHYHGKVFDVTHMEPRISQNVVYVQPPGLPVKVRPDGSSAEGTSDGIWLEQVERAEIDLTNHHNALKCPYCNPKGLTFAVERAEPSPDFIDAVGWLLDAIKSEVNHLDDKPLLKSRFGVVEKALLKAVERAEQHSCLCGVGPEPCPNTDGTPLCCVERAEVAGEAVAWRHKKRGSVVTEIGRGKAQAATGPIDEMEDVVVYQHDGKIWVRAVTEFEDGRFERLASPPRSEGVRASPVPSADAVPVAGSRIAFAERRNVND